jgi:hypothetical protein
MDMSTGAFLAAYRAAGDRNRVSGEEQASQ